MDEINSEMIKKTRNFIKNNLAQEDSKENRFYKENNINHLGEEFEKYIERSEFNRDADRILYSKAFRRLEHKAQVYSNKRGDHYRTRLTHTLEVTQIARSISRNLGLNEQLTEAIALGHDIGHTPFGHAGEEILDDIMRGKDNLDGKLEFNIDYGGFKHNFNCLKILEIIEKRETRTGLNLTWQTLDGILKHTHVIKGDKKWDLTRFVRDISNYENIIEYDYFDEKSKPSHEHSLTLEGQVVNISDEIAQKEHDLDDSLIDGKLFKLDDMFNEIMKIMEEVSKETSSENTGYELFCLLKKKVYELYSTTKNHKKWKELISVIISYFIIDVTENTIQKINEYDDLDDIIYFDEKNNKYIKEEIVGFSQSGSKVNEKIDEYIEQGIIFSFNVSRFDGKGKYILRQLFKAYYENPRQMPEKELTILIKRIKQTIKKYPQLRKKYDDIAYDFDELFSINEYNVYSTKLNPVLNILKFKNREKLRHTLNSNKNFSEFLKNIMDIIGLNIEEKIKHDFEINEIVDEFYEHLFNYCNTRSIEEINSISNMEHRNFLLFSKGWNELHYEYISTICDYISEMTDNYAIKEYHELYIE